MVSYEAGSGLRAASVPTNQAPAVSCSSSLKLYGDSPQDTLPPV